MRLSKAHLGLGLAVLLVSSCSDAPTPSGLASDADAQTTLLLLTQSAQEVGIEVTNRFVMRYEGELPDEASTMIAAMGGEVLEEWEEIGYGMVRGIDDAQARELDAVLGAGSVTRDLIVQWIPSTEDAIHAQIEGPSVQTDQSGTFFFPTFQWNLRQIDADDAWLSTAQAAGTRVAILDTGIDPGHADLQGKVDPASASLLTPGSSPCGSFDETTILDLNFHGSFVGALVSSAGFAMGSVAPDASLIGVKVLNCSGSGSFGDVAAGIVYAASVGADVINMSLGALVPSNPANPDLKAAIEALMDLLQGAIDFANDQGTFVVASSGNDGLNFDDLPDGALHDDKAIHVPSMLDGVLSVGATAPIAQANFDALASYTSLGQHGADVMAPGGDLVPGGFCNTSVAGPGCDLVLSVCSSFVCGSSTRYVFSAGTSFAAPLAAGAAAVVIGEGKDPGDCLIRGADRIDGRGNSHAYSRGRINVVGAATCVDDN